MCVGPNIVSTGRSNAAAKCRGPLSVVTSKSARRTHATGFDPDVIAAYPYVVTDYRGAYAVDGSVADV